MKKMVAPLLPFFMSSCVDASSMGTIGIISLFAFLIFAMIGISVFVAKKKKDSKGKATKFFIDIKTMLDKINDPKEKINSLDRLIHRINLDEQYKKNTSWQDTVLSKVYQHKALIYFQMDDKKRIIEACSDIIKVEPSHMMSYYNRGSTYSNLGQFEKAIADLGDAISLNDKYVDAYNNRGFAYHKIGEYDKAIADYNYAISLQPSAITHYNRGNTFASLNNIEKALHDYEAALSYLSDVNSNLRENIETAISEIRPSSN